MSSAGAFVGRAGELAALHEELLLARGRQPRLVWLSGDAGIGKTSLLRRFTSPAIGATVLWAGADEAETGLAFGVVDQLRGELRVRSPGVALPATGPADPLDVGAELLAELGRLQAAHPVVLVVDDAQWIDEQSARALVFLIRRLRQDRVLVVLGIRASAGSGAPGPWERALAQEHLVRRLSIAGLSAAELAELVRAVAGRALPAAAVRRLQEHTGGHPLYARALLEELPADGTWADPPTAAGEEQPSPAERAFLRGLLSLWSDRPAPAAAALAELVRQPPQGMRMQARVLLLGHLAEAQYRLGEWDEAAAHAELAISLGEDAGVQLAAGVAQAVAAHVASGRGQWAHARRRVAAAGFTAAALPWWAARAHAATSAATLAQAEGDPAAMLTALAAFDDPSVLTPVDAIGALAWRALRVEALLGVGAPDRAEDALAQLEARVADRPGA